MDTARARAFTLRFVIPLDMLLNGILGVGLAFIPAAIDGWLGKVPLMPTPVYRVIGVLLLLFAIWQLWVVIRQEIGPGGLFFASLMAEIPVFILTSALVFMDLPLHIGWRIVLWVGDAYMLLLGAWYVYLARGLFKEKVRVAKAT